MKNKNQLPTDMTPIGEEIRRLIIDMSYRSKSGETGSALCISDILAVLYFRILTIDPKKSNHPSRDRFILSKGHGAAALYATLALRGFFPLSLLEGYRMDKGALHLHPSAQAAAGIEVSTGSLGHGLSIGAGLALAFKKDAGPLKKVFVLIGDGECNEGSIWEAAMFIKTHNLTNLIAIIDHNKFQGFGETLTVHTMDLRKKWTAFGWNVFESSGHDPIELEKVFLQATHSDRPAVILADTINGKGVPEIENTLRAHYFVPDENTFNNSKKKI